MLMSFFIYIYHSSFLLLSLLRYDNRLQYLDIMCLILSSILINIKLFCVNIIR